MSILKKTLFKIIIIILFLFLISIVFKNEFVNLFNNISNSFTRTLILENRYILILNGLKATMIISILSILFGTILGTILCFIGRSKIKTLSKIVKIIIKFMQGIPITVMLLIFYYVIFGTISINPIIVAVITFSIYFSAYISEVLKGAFDSINYSQIEAAYSLGFSKFQTIKYIILPQTLSYIIPTYKNEVVSLIKLTSIAGYISIMDLTKASDIIRNRTYEAFFPLIITAIIYLIICYLVGIILDKLYKKINPRYYHKRSNV